MAHHIYVGRIRLDAFTAAYIACMLWTNERNDLAIDELPDDTLARCIADCVTFQEGARRWLETAYAEEYTTEQAGHDFWLTRNHHGSGFWDGDLPKEIGDALTKRAHEAGEAELFDDENGKPHFS